MKFETAFDRAFEIQKKRDAEKGVKFVVSPRTANTLAFLWNMLAAVHAESGDFVLDDFAFIVDNNGVFDIASIPIDREKKNAGKGQKPPKVATEPTGGNNDSEK